MLKLPLIVGTLPNNIQNGQTADAVPLMADLNFIVNQVNANAAPLSNTALLTAANSFTAVQSGIAATSAANFPIVSQVQQDVFRTFQSTLGTNQLTARCAALALTAWTADSVFTFIPSQTNTGSSNITVDSAGSSIIFSMGSTLVGGEMRAGVPAEVKRDGTKLNLLNPANVRFDLASSASGSGVRILIANTPAVLTIGKQPTRTVLTSGSGNYQSISVRFNVRIIGGGGSGGGGGTGGGNGNAGNNTTFDVLTAGGGGAGAGSATAGGGVGGTATGGDINIPGGSGSGSSNQGVGQPGGAGGNSAFGGGGGSGNGGTSTAAAGAGAANSGGGGGGGATNNNVSNGGTGGGAGGYCEKLYVVPAGTVFAYAVGAASTGGLAGTNGLAGGNGGSGIIIIDEYYE